jgi:hypothetical protein
MTRGFWCGWATGRFLGEKCGLGAGSQAKGRLKTAVQEKTSAFEAGGERGLLGPYIVLALVAVGMLAYAQTMAFHWDEGFHLLAARLIDAGKRPYLDFVFPQTPLNAYWNAMWMAIFGQSWHVVHALATLATVGSILLIARYVSTLFPERQWRQAAAFAALALFGLHSEVWIYGTIAQAYALCLLLSVAAYRSAIAAVARARPGMSALAGLFAGAAAASTLLTAAVGPVLLIWMWFHNRSGNRLAKAAAFLAGGALACTPVLVLFARGPQQALFNLLEYNTIYRRVAWPGATGHDLGVVTDWINSSPSLLLVLLAVAGLLFMKKDGFDSARRAELHLCLWLVLAVGTMNLFAHPTFPQYFIFLIPFLAVLATAGFLAAVARLGNANRPRPWAIGVVCVMALSLGNSIYEDRDSDTWHDVEQVAEKVEQVTPRGAPLYAPEQIYFLARWPVPSGMEVSDSHKLQFTPARAALLHVLPRPALDREIQAGAFATAVSCDDDEIEKLKSWKVYSQSVDFDDCSVFWALEKAASKPSR